MWARDEQTGAVECRQVVAPYANPDRAIIELELVDEQGRVEVIETTDNHPFFVEDEGFTRVDELRLGDRIPSGDGSVLSVERIYLTGRVETVYNFGVDDFRTYFVGESGAWVHNCWAGGAEKALKHFKKHRKDFPHLDNAKQYVDEATEFLNEPPATALSKMRPRDGATVVFDPKTNRFGVETAEGKPATYFKPEPQKYGYDSSMDYFNAQ